MLGAILSVSFSLFGYVYVLTRASFHYQSQNLIDLGKNLGFSRFKSFFNIILPAARPAIVAGLSLVAMETLAEFGAVDFFSINTLTTGIYNSWIAFDDLAFANRISFFCYYSFLHYLFWRIFLVLGSLAYLGASGLFALKLLAAATGRKRIIDIFIR